MLSIVKKVAEKKFQYLELQSPIDNGWKDLMGYINTKEIMQKKGFLGRIK